MLALSIAAVIFVVLPLGLIALAVWRAKVDLGFDEADLGSQDIDVRYKDKR
jgi:hypothetical protein